MSLFEEYCFPSMLAQINKNFVWCLLFDEKTPRRFIERIEVLKEKMDNIVICLLPFYEDYNDAYALVGRKYASQYDYLLSTRLDNDDSINSHYIEMIQREFYKHTEKFPMILTFKNGYQWYRDRDVLLKVTFEANHFSTMIEKCDSTIKTVLGYSHIDAKLIVSFSSLQSAPMWLEVIHSTNIVNGFTWRIVPRMSLCNRNLNEFNIKISPANKFTHLSVLSGFYAKALRRFLLRTVSRIS